MKLTSLLSSQSIVDKLRAEELERVESIRRKAEKDSRVKHWYDKLLLRWYITLVKLLWWTQKALQRAVNHRNKYSETWITHESTRIFAEMLQGDQLDVLKELNILRAWKIDDSKLMITFGKIERDEEKYVFPDEGMFIVVEAVNDHDATFLKIGMDTWEKENDSARRN